MNCLFYIAGNLMNYQVVDYVIHDKEIRTFFAAHALYKAFNPDRVVTLLPDSLIQDSDWENVKKAYKNMILFQARNINFEQLDDIKSFINKLEIYPIPNAGIAKAFKGENGEIKDTKPTIPYSKDRGAVFIFNVIYSILQDYSCDSYIIDLTHGTNVLTTALLTAGSLFNSTFYSAPVMGPPERNSKVKVVELTELVEAMRDSLMIASSIEMLDERYFRDYKSNLEKLNPNNFKDKRELISRIKGSEPGMIIDLLWNIRNGFTVNAIKAMKDVSLRVQELKGDTRKLTSHFIDWSNNPDLDVKEIVLPHFYSTLKVEDILGRTDDLSVLRHLLDLYVKAKLYDKALSLARELPVAFCLKFRGGGTFEKKSQEGNNSQGNAKEVKGNEYEECKNLVTNYYGEEQNAIIQYRNILMHGGLSEDLKVSVDGEGRLNVGNTLKRKSIEDLIKDLGNKVDKVINRIESNSKKGLSSSEEVR
ncbi:TM1812 family CRISPR-associated protein [Metallosphaera hakonensis]|uniref:CRISPR-associated protein n=1 Tax=Metallosphaera hakonensis JCM 8857 = DSM 7519 TaxID=1293036 RepID=A0A2U9IRN6_9CREN|nr:TM1812 family CRISPR-associated protein [Metallosphaera hakonensis]AWR98654.1 CRISPR-associated protein [Metallosphaera hakonensis JCM 8857 = DSM 7519]